MVDGKERKMKMKNNDLSKFLCMILRHKPETIGITLDSHGWADINELIRGINNYYGDNAIDHEKLAKIVDTDNKNRYSIDEDFERIRCNQGHSIKVDVELKQATPPSVLYHGTTIEALQKIKESGHVSKMSRLYIHMNQDVSKAEQSAKRWKGKIPTVLWIDTDAMVGDGYEFYLSENGVWLVNDIPIKYVLYAVTVEKEK